MLMLQQHNISSILKYLRNDRHYTQHEISPKLHITEQAYSHYETGSRTPPYDILYQLSQLYQIDFSLLVTALEYEHEHLYSFILLDQFRHLTKSDQHELLCYTKTKATKKTICR